MDTKPARTVDWQNREYEKFQVIILGVPVSLDRKRILSITNKEMKACDTSDLKSFGSSFPWEEQPSGE
jgi:hypothetical protein